MKLSYDEKQFVQWALEYVVSANAVNINPEGFYFFRRKFFEEMKEQEPFLTGEGKRHLHQIFRKTSARNISFLQ